MENLKMKNEIIKILWKYSMFNKGVINEHHYKDMASEIVKTVAKNLHKSLVSGRSELLVDFAKKAFLPAYSPNNPEKCVEEYLKSTNSH